MTLPSNISYGTVVGRFIRAVIDGSDPDRDPDGIPLAGLIIRFTPSSSVFKNVTAEGGPVTILADSIAVTTNEDGLLIGPDSIPGIRLVATDDPDLNPTGWTWRVSITGSGISINFSFRLPSDGTVDLTTLVPVPSDPGKGLEDWEVAVTRAESAVSLAEGASVDAALARDEAVAAKEAAEAVPATSDALMASNVGTGGEFDTKLSATIGALVQPVADEVVDTAITEADIPGQVTTATGAAITNADIPGLVDAAVGPAVTAEVGEQAPPLVTAEVGIRVPPAVDAAITGADIPGKVAVALAAQAGKIIQGTGMPNGVVTATPGTLYVDTASTMGASVWRKASGTGSSGWVVVSGDTGWRDIAGQVSNGWALGMSGFLRIRRTADGVQLWIRHLDPTDATSDYPIVGMQDGFLNEANNTIAPLALTFAGAVTTVMPRRLERDIRIPRATGMVGDRYTSTQTRWLCLDAWPSTLPGTAA